MLQKISEKEIDGLFQNLEWDELDREELLSEETFETLYMIKDAFKRKNAFTSCLCRARDLKISKDFQALYKAYGQRLASAKGTSGGNITEFVDQPLELNCGEWIANQNGVKKNEMSSNSDGITVKTASPIPILPIEILENMDTGTEKIKLAFYKNEWRTVICERSKVSSNTKIIELADKGIEVNSENSKLLVKYIADCVALNLDTIPRYKAISRLGWIEKQFMPYDMEIKFDGEKENKPLYDAVCQKGSYEKWVEYVGKLRKNIYLRLQMAASFASPIIEKVNALPFVLHLWGGTGSGKTVGLFVAMSIWGNPVLGKMSRTMNMTKNSTLSTSAFLCNLPFAGDELQLIKTKGGDYDTLIMQVTEGIDRGRMTYDRNNEMKTWKNSFLFTGEEPCTKSSSGGGVKNRVIEIECTHEVVENGNSVVNFISENYGYAGIEYIKNLREEKNLLERYTNIFNDIISSCDTTEKQAMAMSLMMLADDLAIKYIFTDEMPLTIDDVKEFLTSKKDVDVTERAYEFTVNFIAKNNSRFYSDDNSGEFWGKHFENYVFINKDVLCKALRNEGYDFDACKTKWFDKGYIVKNSQGRFIHQRDICHVRASYVKINLPQLTE